jgi:predicted small lipoprotein YifL
VKARAIRHLLPLALAGMSLGGCGQQQPLEPPHSVSWYMAHQAERVSKQRWCAEDAGRQGSPDCINAVEADQKVMMQPNARTSADNLKFP